jgi:hypothetical protein
MLRTDIFTDAVNRQFESMTRDRALAARKPSYQPARIQLILQI